MENSLWGTLKSYKITQEVTEIIQARDYGAVDQSGITSRQLDNDIDTEVWMSRELNTYAFL